MNKVKYILRIADTSLILGHRLSEWCGHGPILEQDMALTNIALDLVGQARSLYQYAAKVEGKGKTEDDLAYLRSEMEYLNPLIAELPNGNFADTIARQFFCDVYNYAFYSELKNSKDETLAAIAEKSLKEVRYHQRYSSEWIFRLGDGTEESHAKMQTAINNIWMYTGELTTMDELDSVMFNEGIGVDLEVIKPIWQEKVKSVLAEATLIMPEVTWAQSGGKEGKHTEHLGFILAQMQHLQRMHPGAIW